MFPRSFPKSLSSLALIAVATIAGWMASGEAHAQQPKVLAGNQVIFPAGLKWERLVETTVNFDAKYARAPEDQELKSLSQRLWTDEVEKSLKNNPKTGVFFLSKKVDLNGSMALISIADFPLNYEQCMPPADGKNAQDMFSVCKARLLVTNGQLNQSFEISNVCYLNIDNDNKNPVEKNHTAIATDPKSSTIYLRVIQYGKAVPGCNRAIRL